MKHSKPDPNQAKALEELKTKYLGKRNQENNQSPVSTRQSRILHSQESALQAEEKIDIAQENLPGDQQLPYSEDAATNLDKVKRQFPDKRNQENNQSPFSRRRQPRNSRSQEYALQGKEKDDMAQESALNSH